MGVVEKSSLRFVDGLAALRSLAHAVQFDVVLPLRSHLSAE